MKTGESLLLDDPAADESGRREDYVICRTFRLGYLWLVLGPLLFSRRRFVFIFLIPGAESRWWLADEGIFRRWLRCRIRVEECPVDVLGMTDEHGSAVAMRAAYETVDRFIDAFDAVYLGDGSLLGKLKAGLSGISQDLRLWINAYVSMDIFEPLVLVSIAEWLGSNSASRFHGKKLRVIVEAKNSWAALIRGCVRGKNIEIVFWKTRRAFKEGVCVNTAYQFANILLSLGRSLFGKPKTLPESSVCSFHEGPASFTDLDRRRSYALFWLPPSGIDPKRVTVFSYGSLTLSAPEVEGAGKTGIRFFSCEGFFRKINPLMERHVCSAGAIRAFMAYVVESLRLLSCVRSREDYRVWHCLTVLFSRLPYWEDFFRVRQVKVFFKPGSFFNHLNIAARLADAAIVSYQSSNHVRTMTWHAENCDAFFVWGKEHEMAYRTKRSRVRNFVQSGYIFDHIFVPLRERAAADRKELFGGKADFIISVLDEYWAYPFALLHLVGMRKEMLLLYQKFFSYALEHQDVGLLVKPKREANELALRSSPETAGAVRRLEQEGRLRFLEAEKYPAQAGVLSDLAVGLYADSTAAFECWLAGTGAISYDVMKFRGLNSLYVKEKNKVVFDDLGLMMAAIDQCRRDRVAIGGSLQRHDLTAPRDPFCDGAARERVGLYIREVLEGFDQGLTRVEAVARANEFYRKKFGNDKVFAQVER